MSEHLASLRRLFVISRPISWVNTAYPFAAGYLLTGGQLSPLFFIASFYFLIPYNLLMYGVNDVFDYESDLRNARKGGIEGAVAAKRFHPTILKAAVASNLPFLAVMLLLGNAVSALVLAGLVFFVIAYSLAGLRFKERPFLDSVTSSLHFCGPLIYALSLAGFSQPAWLAVGAFFLWGMASHAFGAVQDIVPDRSAGLGSIATVIGGRATVWLALGLYLISLALAAQLGPVGLVTAAAGLLYAANLLPYLAITDHTSAVANAGWRRFLWINYLVGAVLTISLIYQAVV